MERLDFLEEKYLAKNTQLAEDPSKLKEFVRQYFPEIAFSENWQELFSNEVKSFTERITSFQESLKTVATRWNFHYIPGLEHGWFETMEKKLQYSQALEKQLMDTNMKLNSIYEKMLSNLDYNTKMTALQNPTTLDQQFFDWVRNGVQQLRNDLDAARTQLVLAIESPSNYEVTEVVENLPALCGVDTDSELKQERDHLKVERDQLKEENDHLKTERNQLKDEKGQLMIENGLLKENRDIFWRETEILRNEKDVLKAERDQCLKGSDRLKKKTNLLKVEGDEWKQRCTELEHELKQEKFRLAEHCNVLQEELELFHKECKKLVDPFKIQTFVMDVQKKYGLTQDIYKNFIEFLNHFNMTLTTHNWPQEIISKFKQLECLKGKYETLLVDHDEMQNKYEKDLERIVETNNTQQNHLKQQLRECEAELQDCRDKLLEAKSETLVEGGSCTPIKNKKFKRRSIANTEDNDEDWKTKYFELEKQLSQSIHDVSLVQMKCLFMAFFQLYFKLTYNFKWKKLPDPLAPELIKEVW
ncbi:hypothetical protein TNCT_703451 [Trichonephila clavata]|uniref:Uncharacterized protein n=1 Tax=Trichonephila clavata TaxID=2740835 RepID=A0A8X6KH34_TRICU|nr:hypothetical protein TNCT_703451 [Trichonephila clavata]